jgi:hypothetical protein
MMAALLVTGSYAGAEMAGGQVHPGARASEPVNCTCPCETKKRSISLLAASNMSWWWRVGATGPCGVLGPPQVTLQSGKVFGADDRDCPDVALAQEGGGP